jgi:uncharacterized membrane protein YdjX (TVP38/TMEM64 family)
VRLIWIAVALAVLFLIPFVIWEENFTSWFTGDAAVTWIQGWGPLGWLAVVILLMLDIVLPLPGTAIMSAAGYLYGTLGGGLICTAGSFLSGMTAYGLCRSFGHTVAVKLAGAEDLARGERLFRRNGVWLVALSRSLPLLAEVGSCLAGLTRMPFPYFTIALAIGCAPMAFIFSFIGSIGHENAGLALGLSVAVPAVLWTGVKLWYHRTTDDSASSPSNRSGNSDGQA